MHNRSVDFKLVEKANKKMINFLKKPLIRLILPICVFGVFLLSSVPAVFAAPLTVAPQSVLATHNTLEGAGDQMQGKANQALGRTKKELGALKSETEGTLIEGKGKTQEAAGKAKASLDRVSSRAENRLDKAGDRTENATEGLVDRIKHFFD